MTPADKLAELASRLWFAYELGLDKAMRYKGRHGLTPENFNDLDTEDREAWFAVAEEVLREAREVPTIDAVAVAVGNARRSYGGSGLPPGEAGPLDYDIARAAARAMGVTLREKP